MQIPNIILPGFRIIIFYERKYVCSDSRLDAKKDLFTVHEIQEKPFYHDIANGHYHDVPGVPNPLTQPFEKAIGCVFPVNKMTGHIDQNRIHADHFKIKRPFFITLHVNQVIKNRQQDQTITTYI